MKHVDVTIEIAWAPLFSHVDEKGPSWEHQKWFVCVRGWVPQRTLLFASSLSGLLFRTSECAEGVSVCLWCHHLPFYVHHEAAVTGSSGPAIVQELHKVRIMHDA